jgi:hypothetical protein
VLEIEAQLGYDPPMLQHPRFTRRTAIQAGSIGLLGLGTNHLAALTAASAANAPVKSVIYIFLSGGLSQIDSFDLKPAAPAEIRGEFKPIKTRTPGVEICEHLPLLAGCSQHWSLVRSLTHPSNDHSAGHMMMLTGRSQLPPGFNPNAPRPEDWPAMAAVVGDFFRGRNNLPPAVVLPERLVHFSGRVIPGQFAGQMGSQREPWFIEASAYEPRAYGPYPQYEFDHQQRTYQPKRQRFDMPNLSLPEGFSDTRLGRRMDLLRHIDQQRRTLDREAAGMDRLRQGAVSLLLDRQVRAAFDVEEAEPRRLDRYGRNAFGWSLLMARQLVEAGVRLVQVNLGNNETWDTHGNAFPHLKDKLFPPTDRALSALVEDLHERGMLESTLLVMAGEFGRTPRISTLPQHYKLPGRDHWGAVQSVWLAGGGTRAGTVIGASDRNGGYPSLDPQTPENLAATIYHSLGIPPTAAWHDAVNRPHFIYHGEPIRGLLS